MNSAFLFSSKDVAAFLAKRNPAEKITVYASGRATYRSLTKAGIRYREIRHFIPISSTKKHYLNTQKIASRFDPSIYATVKIFLLEIRRSSYLTGKLLKKHRPAKVYLSDVINESLFVKYHRETFNLLPQAIIGYCRKNKIPVTVLRRERQPGSLTGSLISQTVALLRLTLLAQKTPPSPPTKRPAILVSASDYHLTNLKEFVNQAGKQWAILVLGKSTAAEKKQIRAAKPTYLDYYRFVKLSDLLNLWLYQLKVLLSWIIRPPRADCLQADLVPSPILEQSLKYWQLTLAAQGKLLTRVFHRIIDRYHPQILASSNSIDNFSRLLHLTAKSEKLANITILHYPTMNETDVIEEQAGVESILMVASQEAVRLLQKYPLGARVVAVGNPAFDQYRTSRPARPIKKRPLRLLFLLTQDFLYFKNYNDQIIFEALSELAKLSIPIKVTLRQHPQEKPLPDYSGFFSFPIRLGNKTSLKDELPKHHLVITQSTTAALDAMFLHQPLIYLQIGSVRDLFPFTTSGAALGVYRKSQLVPAIESLIQNPKQLIKKQDQFLNKYCPNISNQASSSQRILRFIDELQLSPDQE